MMQEQNNYDKQFIQLIDKILIYGKDQPCRTGNMTRVLLNQVLTWDLKDGFPILTFRPIPFKGIKAEMECFLHGITDKRLYEEKGCKYWKEWCNPKKVPVGLTDTERKTFQLTEPSLGPIYGFQWRFFGADYKEMDTDYNGQGFDQIKYIVDTFNKNKYDRRLILNAWNPLAMDAMALPPCVYGFQLNWFDDRLHMTVQQRSCDLILGVPADMAGYALILHLLAKTLDVEPGTITFNLCNCHIYDNHFDIIAENMHDWRNNCNYALPELKLKPETDVFNFKADDAELLNYQHGPKVTFPIAV